MRIEVDAKSNFREFLRNALRVGSVLVGVVALFEDGGGADDVVGGGFAAGWFQGDAHRQALPLSGLADRNEVVGLGPRADLLLDHGAACAELRHDGEETALGCGGDAAVGGVVAEPDHVGDSGVEVRQMQRGDVAGDAIDGQPGAGLPDPVRNGVGWQCVVEAKGAANGEGAVGDVVNLAGSPLFLVVVDEERADFEGGGLVGFGVWGCVGLGVGDSAKGAEGDGVDLGDRSEKGSRRGKRA